MKFCPKCKSIMMPKGKQLVCSCGYKESGEVKITEKTEQKTQEVAIVEKEERVHPIIDAECPKCGHDKAEYWEVQTRAADEPATRFFKCVKCKSTWREYS